MVDRNLLKELKLRIKLIENPPRRALSSKFPVLKRPIIFTRRILRNWGNFLDSSIVRKRSTEFYSNVWARHQSVLIRKLGNSDLRLQKNKIINLKRAIEKLNGIIIPSGKTFSLWYLIGQPSKRRGYVEGMLLAQGRVVEGVGGGLCQLANFLFWIMMHVDVEVVERYHHSYDVFPDSGRVLPFGSGATVLYNFVDLKIKNVSNHPIQLKMWLTDKYLKGQLLSDSVAPKKFHVFEKNHYFIKKGRRFYRYNEIWRETLVLGRIVKEERIVTNLAPVLYDINEEYIAQNNYRLIKI